MRLERVHLFKRCKHLYAFQNGKYPLVCLSLGVFVNLAAVTHVTKDNANSNDSNKTINGSKTCQSMYAESVLHEMLIDFSPTGIRVHLIITTGRMHDVVVAVTCRFRKRKEGKKIGKSPPAPAAG